MAPPRALGTAWTAEWGIVRAQGCAAPHSPRPQGRARAHLGCGKGTESSWPCAGIGVGPRGGSRSSAGVIRVKQRESAPNSSACSWAVLSGAPATGGACAALLQRRRSGGRGQPSPPRSAASLSLSGRDLPFPRRRRVRASPGPRQAASGRPTTKGR